MKAPKSGFTKKYYILVACSVLALLGILRAQQSTSTASTSDDLSVMLEALEQTTPQPASEAPVNGRWQAFSIFAAKAGTDSITCTERTDMPVASRARFLACCLGTEWCNRKGLQKS